MSKFTKVCQQVDFFYKLAYLDLDKVIENVKYAVQAEVAGGIRSINHLYTTNPTATKSEALSLLDETFSRIAELSRQMTSLDAKSLVSSIMNQINSVSFYISKSNAGTGYDPSTRIGDEYSPAAYLDRITAHLKRFDSYLNNMPKGTAQV